MSSSKRGSLEASRILDVKSSTNLFSAVAFLISGVLALGAKYSRRTISKIKAAGLSPKFILMNLKMQRLSGFNTSLYHQNILNLLQTSVVMHVLYALLKSADHAAAP